MLSLSFISFFTTLIYSTVHKDWLKKNKSFFNKKEVEQKLIKASSHILENMGYDLKENKIKLSSSTKESHIHCLFFLKCPDQSPFLIFEDPRINKKKLPLKDKTLNTPGLDEVVYKPIEGSLIFFPSYLKWKIKKNKKLKYIKKEMVCKK